MGRLSALAVLGGVAMGNAGCTGAAADRTPPTRCDAVGLALEVDNGHPVPLQLRQGQTFFLNQIDLRASTTASRDEGVAGLARQGDFAPLVWNGITQNDQEFILLANADGTFQRRRFFRDADWMNTDTVFELEQLDASGVPSEYRSIPTLDWNTRVGHMTVSSIAGCARSSGRTTAGA